MIFHDKKDLALRFHNLLHLNLTAVLNSPTLHTSTQQAPVYIPTKLFCSTSSYTEAKCKFTCSTATVADITVKSQMK